LKAQAGLSGQLDARLQRELLDVAAAVKHGLTDADASPAPLPVGRAR
jgi:molecular chaperone HscA